MALGIWRTVAVVFVQLSCANTFAPANAGGFPCKTPLVLVDTEDRELHGRICKTVESALPRLAECKLTLVDPILISFTEQLDLGSPELVCFGRYHLRKDRIELLKPTAFERSHSSSKLWAPIPMSEHFDSVVVHEFTHALLDQATLKEQTCRADDEYIAYAMQMASLSESTRVALIASVAVSAPTSTEEINSTILNISPVAFAIKSWLHFSQPENGCDFVEKIIRGETTFFLLPE